MWKCRKLRNLLMLLASQQSAVFWIRLALKKKMSNVLINKGECKAIASTQDPHKSRHLLKFQVNKHLLEEEARACWCSLHFSLASQSCNSITIVPKTQHPSILLLKAPLLYQVLLENQQALISLKVQGRKSQKRFQKKFRTEKCQKKLYRKKCLSNLCKTRSFKLLR